MPVAGDMENEGLIYGGKVLASTVRLAQTGPMELRVSAGVVRVPELGGEAWELEEDVTIDFSAHPDSTYPVSVVMDLVLHQGKVKMLVDRVMKNGPARETSRGGRTFGARQHLDFRYFPHPTDPRRPGDYMYTNLGGGALSPEHADKRHIVRLVRASWFVFPPGATELPTISYLKVVQDLDLVRRNRHAKRAAVGI